ncbi:hypothetical protein SAMN05444354_1147 [Stigmatella aurantiaca]|uniref:Uncharacterized protein n=1 Tax=Stigmatella aurantiaca TaxID=41 RepID=A0A1H7WZG9_STIAU|nr:hypothetical protein [Stigmatella aurantiaca]SEM26309.1 hypothetical protein SAMN05444354_1147 [Stigmatella aurantiaca]
MLSVFLYTRRWDILPPGMRGLQSLENLLNSFPPHLRPLSPRNAFEELVHEGNRYPWQSVHNMAVANLSTRAFDFTQKVARQPDEAQTEALKDLEHLLGREGVQLLSDKLRSQPSLRAAVAQFSRLAYGLSEIDSMWATFVPSPQATIDLETLVTTVQDSALSELDFDKLVSVLDPREWKQSKFWRRSDRVTILPGQSTSQVIIDTPPSGSSWSGNLYEYVEWNWNVYSISAFQVYLNIQFEVMPEPKGQREINMDFSLHSCRGSMLYARVADTGVDVDSGFVHVTERLPGKFIINAEKRIRYSNIVDSRSALQGFPGGGMLLSLLAPAVVGLWMHELIAHIYSRERMVNLHLQSESSAPQGDAVLRGGMSHDELSH